MPPQLKTSVILLTALLGCVNRGQHASSDGGGSGGAGAGVGGMDGGNVDLPKDMRGVGGAGGSVCVPVDGGTDGGADAGMCNAKFNFENCATYGAALYRDVLNPSDPNTAAFTSVSHTDVAECGAGGLAIGVEFTSTQTGGEVRIPVGTNGSFQDYSGQTITLSMKVDPAGTIATKFYVLLLSTSGFVDFFSSFPFQTDWTTRSVTLSSTDTRLTQITDIVLQARGPVDAGAFTYTGTIYVDEIDLRKLPPDGGASDVPDGGASDIRPGDAGAADVRDAPSGN